MTLRKYKTLLWCCVVFSVAAAGLRAVMIKAFVDTDAGSYTDYSRIKLADNVMTSLFPYMVVTAVVAFLLFSLLTRRNVTGDLSFFGTPTVFFSSLTGFMMVTTAAMQIYYRARVPGAELSGVLIVAALMLACAVYFLYLTSKKLDVRGRTCSVLSLAPVAFLFVRLLNYFFEINSRPNSATSLFHLFSLAALMLFFVCEGKFSVGTGNGGGYVFFGLSSVLLTFVYALPELVLSAFWLVSWQTDTMFSVLELLMCMYVIARLAALPIQGSDSTD